MCKHCTRLTEDKDIVHAFFERMALRFNESLPGRVGRPLHRPVTADDIVAPKVTVNAVFWIENNISDEDRMRVMLMIEEMDDSGYYRVHPERTITPEDNERLRVEMEKD